MSESAHDHEHDSHGGGHVEWLELGRIGFVGLAIVATWLRLWQPLPHFDIAGVRGCPDRRLPDIPRSSSPISCRGA